MSILLLIEVKEIRLKAKLELNNINIEVQEADFIEEVERLKDKLFFINHLTISSLQNIESKNFFNYYFLKLDHFNINSNLESNLEFLNQNSLSYDSETSDQFESVHYSTS